MMAPLNRTSVSSDYFPVLTAFRQWRRRSLANTVALQASVIAIGSGLLVALISLIVLYWSQSLALQDQMREKAIRLTERVERTINVAESASADLAKNTIFISALLDSEGRNVYVEPFLKNFTLPIPAANGIALCDINGVRLAGTLAGMSDCHADSPQFAQVLHDGKTARALLPLSNGHLAWTIFQGVAYSYSGTIEGIVVTQLDLHDIFAAIPSDLDLEHVALVRSGVAGDLIHIGPLAAADSGMVSSRRLLFKHSASVTPFPLEVVIWSHRSPMSGALLPLLTSYGVGILALFLGVMIGTRRISLRLIEPLARLTEITREIAATGNMEVEIPLVEHGELGQLSSAFLTLVNAVRHSEENLESQVVMRTRQLQAAEASLRSVFDAASGMAIIAMDTAGRITLFNPGAERILGYQAVDVIGNMTLSQFHLTDELSAGEAMSAEPAVHDVTELERLLACLGVDESSAKEWTWLRKDGSNLAVSVAVTSIRNGGVDVSGYLCIAEDVTDRRAAETKLRESELRFRGLFENTPVAYLSLDITGRYIDVNQQLCDMLGYSRNELIGRSFEEFWIDDLKPVFTEKFDEFKSSGHMSIELALKMKNGSVVNVLLNGRIQRDPDGSFVKTHCVLADISDRKRMEDAILKSKEQAEAMAHAKSEFLANMSHEIRTPMNGIIGLTQLALNQQSSPELRDYLSKISSSSQSLLGILNDILDFSKLDAGRMTVEHSPFDLDEVLDNLRNLFEQRAHAKGLDFLIDVSGDTPRSNLIGDAMRLQQILSNLLGNAIKFTEIGQIALKVGASEFHAGQLKLRFAVTDTGIGISAEEQQRLFQPFSQADSSITRRFGGTGLGLAISRDLLALMGGDIAIESTPGQGSTFSFELLLDMGVQEPARTVRRRGASEEGGLKTELHAQAGLLHGARILVAEDNSINQQIVKEFLKLSGMNAVIANNGQDAIALLLSQPFDAVLMDVSMPVMDGLEATRQLRRQPVFEHLPIIALTAGVTEEERENCLASGMNDFIAKPINPEQLINTLLRWVKL